MIEQDVMDTVEEDGYEPAERYAIMVAEGELPREIDDVQRAIYEDVYHRGGVLVRLRRNDQDLSLEAMSRGALDVLIARRCHFEKEIVSKKSGHVTVVQVNPPERVVSDIHTMDQWPLLREIRQITAVPFIRPDGSVGGLEPGYDAASKVYANVPHGLPAPPEQPTDEEAREALQKLREIVDEFPFASEACESVHIAAILSIIARRFINGPVPLFIVEASKSGSGKTLLARIAATIGTGVDPGLTIGGGSDNEFRKLITSYLLGGQPVLVLDNQTGRLGGPVQELLQTSGKWSDRLLQFNRVATLDNDLVTIITSNNPDCARDTGRRSLIVRLVPDCEHPEYRAFRVKNLLLDVQRRRHELALAAVTILRWHISRGCPEMPATAFGSFEAWSRVVRQLVMSLGMADPLETQELVHELDDQNIAEKAFVLSLAAWNPSWSGLAEELLRAIEIPQAAAPVKSAIVRLCGEEVTGDKEAAAKKLGYKLRALRDRRFDGWAVVRAGDSRKGIRWGLNFKQASGDAAMADKDSASSPHS
jgi:hypothetical protein